MASQDTTEAAVPRSILKTTVPTPTTQKRALPSGGKGQSEEKKSRFSLPTDQPSRNALAVLHEYAPNVDFVLVSQSGASHAPQFTMKCEVDEKTYVLTGPSKKKTKIDLASQVIADIWPVIEAQQQLRQAERDETGQAELDYADQLHRDGKEVSMAIAGEENSDAYKAIRPKVSMRLMTELNLRPKYTVEEEKVKEVTTYVARVELDGATFEGRGATSVFARCIAAAEAMSKLYNVEFVYSEKGYPMYAGDANQFKMLKMRHADPIVERPPALPTSSAAGAPPPPSTTLLVEGRNPVMLLNELFLTSVSYENISSTALAGNQHEFGVKVLLDGMAFEGRGSSIKHAKQNAAVTALNWLKRTGMLAKRIAEKEAQRVTKAKPRGVGGAGGLLEWASSDADITVSEELVTSQTQQNALAKLNELYKGLVYEVSDQSADLFDPWFEVSVVVDGRTYTGGARSKKRARMISAENALRALRLWTRQDEMIKRQNMAANAARDSYVPTEAGGWRGSGGGRSGRGGHFGGDGFGGAMRGRGAWGAGIGFDYGGEDFGGFASAGAPSFMTRGGPFAGLRARGPSRGFGTRGFARGMPQAGGQGGWDAMTQSSTFGFGGAGQGYDSFGLDGPMMTMGPGMGLAGGTRGQRGRGGHSGPMGRGLGGPGGRGAGPSGQRGTLNKLMNMALGGGGDVPASDEAASYDFQDGGYEVAAGQSFDAGLYAGFGGGYANTGGGYGGDGIVSAGMGLSRPSNVGRGGNARGRGRLNFVGSGGGRGLPAESSSMSLLGSSPVTFSGKVTYAADTDYSFDPSFQSFEGKGYGGGNGWQAGPQAVQTGGGGGWKAAQGLQTGGGWQTEGGSSGYAVAGGYEYDGSMVMSSW